MKKWITLAKSVVISFGLYMWFLGSSLLIRIDSESLLEQRYELQRKDWENDIRDYSRRLRSYCKSKEEATPSSPPVPVGGVEELKTVKEARRMKTVRDNLIYIPQLGQLWCLVPKAASTSWSHKIVEFLPSISPKLQRDLRNESIPLQVSLRHHFGHVGTKVLKSLLHSKKVSKILLIRHPFARIVSAFEDKLRNRKAKADSMYFYGHYGVKINRSFRKDRRANKRKEPTFDEFIDYLIETDPLDYDEHWKPISLLCGVCHVKYEHVVRQEDLSRTMSFHLAKLGFLEDPSKAHFSDENKSDWQFAGMGDYFKNVSSDKMEKLYRKYEDDFNLFGYSIPPTH